MLYWPYYSIFSFRGNLTYNLYIGMIIGINVIFQISSKTIRVMVFNMWI